MIMNSATGQKSTMARILLLSLALACLPASVLNAKPKVSCDIKVVARHPTLVTFTWDVKVESDRAWDACDLIISFEDEKGREIHSFREVLSVRAGSSRFSGHEICDAEVWKRIRKYVATFDCVF